VSCDQAADDVAATAGQEPGLDVTRHLSSATRPLFDSTLAYRPLLVFDTETTAPKPGIVQLSYVHVPVPVDGNDGDAVVESDEILRLPEGMKMCPRTVRVHGITKRRSDAGGDPSVALERFAALHRDVQARGGVTVAHNAAFDCRAFNVTCEHLGLGVRIESSEVLCLMKASKPHSPLRTKTNQRKAFKNAELYRFFFGANPDWARLHTALDDAWVTTLNWGEGRKRGWW
jgi:DNA polymerase III epsilon subunit-like protein